MNLIETVAKATPHLTAYVVAATIICLALSPVAARVLRTPAWAAVVPLLALAAVVMLTLTPSIDGGYSNGAHVCGSVLSAPLPPTDLLIATQRSLNVALYLPLGASVFIARGWLRRTVFAAIVLALPTGVEFAQYQWTTLGRTCGLTDVVDNLTGAIYGLLLAGACALLLHVRGRHDHNTAPPAERTTVSP